MLIPLLLSVFDRWYWIFLIPLWFAARVAKRIYMHRHEFGWRLLFNPFVFLGVLLVTLVVDAATFSGWIKAIISRPGKGFTQK
jgi:hypothetical protein